MRWDRGRARLRRRVRLWRASLAKLLPRRAERELFSASVRHLDNRYFLQQTSGYFLPPACARERAALLLMRYLDSVQRSCLRRRGFFVVTGRSGRRFRVWARRRVPVELVDWRNVRPDHRPFLYCVNNESGVLPLADFLLELKLCLEADEEHFLLNSNPNFEQGHIEKKDLVRCYRFENPCRMRTIGSVDR